MLLKEEDKSNISIALNHYTAIDLLIRPFSLSYNKMSIFSEIIDNKLNFQLTEDDLNLTLNEVVKFHFDNEDYPTGFKIEYERYLDETRWYKPEYLHPNLEGLPEPKFSKLRNVIDGYLIEISFEGRVKIAEIEPHSDKHVTNNYWRLIVP